MWIAMQSLFWWWWSKRRQTDECSCETPTMGTPRRSSWRCHVAGLSCQMASHGSLPDPRQVVSGMVESTLQVNLRILRILLTLDWNSVGQLKRTKNKSYSVPSSATFRSNNVRRNHRIAHFLPRFLATTWKRLGLNQHVHSYQALSFMPHHPSLPHPN